MRLGKWLRRAVASSALVATLMAGPQKPAEAREPVQNTPYDAMVDKRLTFGKKDAAVLGLDMGLACAYAGIRTAVRTQDVKKSFEACGKAMIGGAVMYVGQKMGVYSGIYPGMGWGAQAVHSLGASMRDNAAEGIGLFDRYEFDVGVFRFSVGKKEVNGGQNFNFYFMPFSFGTFLYHIANNDQFKFDMIRSLENGAFIFKTVGHLEDIVPNSSGYTSFNTIVVDGSKPKAEQKMVIGHEMDHVLFFREGASLSHILDSLPAVKIKGYKVQPFRFIRERLHLDMGSEAAFSLAYYLFHTVDHDAQPIEFTTVRLQLPVYTKPHSK